MEPSRFNIIAPLKSRPGYVIANLLSGQADLADESEIGAVKAAEERQDFINKGYVVDPAAEEKAYRRAYLDFLDSREQDEIQIFYAPWYACNFACDYCYQGAYQTAVPADQRPVIDAFFNYMDTEFGGRKKYLTLFGGEPLLPGAKARETIASLLEGAARRNLDTAVVTNGYTLAGYLPLLSKYAIREIQVTLDGLEAVHDQRRPLRGGGATFHTIVEGIDAALAAGIPVNLRFNLDGSNIGDLPALARYALGKGWTRHPLFKTQAGRLYELHTCVRDRAGLFTRLSLYEALAEAVTVHPEILEFHKPAFSVARFLFENDRLPAPLFDDCPGAKTEWAFDGAGKIYSCTATVGKDGAALGEFYPAVKKNEQLISRWQERDVTSIPQCRGCPLQLACGGGCAAVAFNRTGDLHAPDCRPVRELLALGAPVYFREDILEDNHVGAH
jgi:uncharacterized protein